MFYVYVLQGENKKTYVGYSSNLKQRIREHQTRHVYTTRRLTNPKLVYYEAYSSGILAKKRERDLKKYGSSYQGLFKRIGINQI